jgi:hypothetical protein
LFIEAVPKLQFLESLYYYKKFILYLFFINAPAQANKTAYFPLPRIWRGFSGFCLFLPKSPIGQPPGFAKMWWRLPGARTPERSKGADVHIAETLGTIFLKFTVNWIFPK